MVFSNRQKIMASVVGIVLAGAPMFAFTAWLNYFIEQQGREEVDQVAQRSLALADRRATRVIETLADLARRGVETCRPTHIEALRQAGFSTAPIKELSVLDSSGATLCTDLGIPAGIRKVMFSQPLTADGDVTIEVVRLGDRKDAMIRIRRTANGGTLAALVPTELFLPLN